MLAATTGPSSCNFRQRARDVPTAVGDNGCMAESEAPATSNRSTTPRSDTFAQYISSQWADRPDVLPSPREQAIYAASRRQRVSELHPGERRVLPAGAAKQRSTDTD